MLLHVPRYDFDWQTSYFFERPKRLPAGTSVEVIREYDNSAENRPIPTRRGQCVTASRRAKR
jgi:hypothetical protein